MRALSSDHPQVTPYLREETPPLAAKVAFSIRLEIGNAAFAQVCTALHFSCTQGKTVFSRAIALCVVLRSLAQNERSTAETDRMKIAVSPEKLAMIGIRDI